MEVHSRRILVDMDGVVVDFEQGFKVAWERQSPDRLAIPLEQRTTFYLRDQYSLEYRSDLVGIYTAPDFVRNLPPIDGAIEALLEIVAAGFTVKICTSPLTIYKNCVESKYAWIEEYLGSEWVNNLILTKDKTEVRADYLIDDRPGVRGDLEPVWQYILFDQQYNREYNQWPRLKHWSEWRQVIPTLAQ